MASTTTTTTTRGNSTQKLTAQQRAQLFAASTRQHFQMIGTKKVVGGAQTVEFSIPKARILQGLRLLVEFTPNANYGAGITEKNNRFIPYKVLRRISLDLNNGFQPIIVSGDEACMINTMFPHGEMVVPPDSTKKDVLETLCAVSSEDGKTAFMLDLPLTLNYRDTSGLVLAQNQETQITLSVDIADASVLGDGVTEYTDMTITAMTTTFSVPAKSEWFPDLSILRVLSSRNEHFSAGNNYVQMQTGMIYRKILLVFQNEDGTPMTDEDITSNIELVFNTADIPYSISPKMLRKTNLMQTGVGLPDGCYFWSFDWQGIVGMGGSRDYIDAERLSELAVRFTSAKAGKITIVSDKISRLIAG